jgi:hypothetical protein
MEVGIDRRPRGNQTLVIVHKFVVSILHTRAKIIENVYGMLNESGTLCDIHIWSLDGKWKDIDKNHNLFCKITPGMPRFAANNVAELEMGPDGRRGNVLRTIAKYQLRLFLMDSMEIGIMYHEWQINNLNVEGWTKN